MNMLPSGGQPLVIFCEFETLVCKLHTEAVLFGQEGTDLEAASAKLARSTNRVDRAAGYMQLRLTLQEALKKLEDAGVGLAPGFEDFAEMCSIRQVRLYILTHGLKPLVRHFLRNAGLGHVEVLGNDLRITEEGAWQLSFRDHSSSGHDKGESLQEALQSSQIAARVVFMSTLAEDFSAVETGLVNTLYTPPKSALAEMCEGAGLKTRVFEGWSAMLNDLQSDG